jgi:hypothetical protein
MINYTTLKNNHNLFFQWCKNTLSNKEKEKNYAIQKIKTQDLRTRTWDV